jgi:hypothetical protein
LNLDRLGHAHSFSVFEKAQAYAIGHAAAGQGPRRGAAAGAAGMMHRCT